MSWYAYTGAPSVLSISQSDELTIVWMSWKNDSSSLGSKATFGKSNYSYYAFLCVHIVYLSTNYLKKNLARPRPCLVLDKDLLNISYSRFIADRSNKTVSRVTRLSLFHVHLEYGKDGGLGQKKRLLFSIII